jgi:hypothetical protein
MSTDKKYPIGGYAPGNYFNTCCSCGNQFTGDKGAVQCEPCAIADKEAFDKLSPEQQDQLVKKNTEAINSFLKNMGTKKEEPTKYCLTTWGEVLKVKGVNNKLVDVSDPDAKDAGQLIPTDEVCVYWLGYRVKDELPNEGDKVRVLVESGQELQTEFINGRFNLPAKYDNLDRVVLWSEPETIE